MHNNIMAAGSRDRPPMLATGRYAQWRSRFLRYIDTRPNGDALRKCILKGPYTPTIVTTPAVPATEDSPAVPEQTTVETVMNMTPENRAHFESEKEAIHLILTGIGDEIYSTVDACQTAQEMWEAIERLQQGKSIAKPNQPPSESASEVDSDPEQAQKERLQKYFGFIAKVLQETLQLPTTNLRNFLITPEENKNVDTNQRETIGGQVVQQSRIQCFNCKEFGHFAKECRKPKWVKDFKYHKVKMLLCKQAEKGVQLQAEQSDYLADTDEDIDEQELEAHYSYMAKIQEDDKYDVDMTIMLKKIDIKEGLKVKAYEISVVKEKHDELVKQSLLTKSHYEGLVKEKTKVITDLKLKEEKDIDKMISMENQIKFLNEIVYKRSQSIQTIHMLAPKCPTFNGRPTFANPRYLKKAQNEIPCLYAIPHDQSDPANRLVPDREETQTLEEESRSKLNKDLVKPFDYTKLNSLRMNSSHFVHELKQEMHADLKYVESLKDVMCSYLQSSSDLDEITELQCLYLHKVRECDCLAQKLSEQTEFVSKEIYTELLQSFAKLEKHSISLEIALQECQEQLKNDTVCKEKASNVF
ncbi:retrovirus-related pol polyprotein from transposon TNT 1-94 [Tanacetum coccineum]